MQYEDEEIWKPIDGTDGYYSVSSYGRVRSEYRVITKKDGRTQPVPERILTPAFDVNGYPVVSICMVSSKKVMKVHRLVAEAFCEKPEGNDVVNHIDNSVDNNHYSNLEWTTTAGNLLHADKQKRRHCSNQNGEKNYQAKQTLQDVLQIRKLISQGHSRKEVREITGLSLKYIGDVVRKKSWNFPEAFPEHYEPS